MSEDTKSLRAEYKEVTGKNPFNGWSADELKEKISAEKVVEDAVASEVLKEEEKEEVPVELERPKREAPLSDFEKMTEEERIAEAHKINTMQHLTMPNELTPVFVDGKPFAIIGNEYIPYAEAEILFEEDKITQAQERIKELKKNMKTTITN